MNVALDESMVKGDSVAAWLESAVDAGGGLLRDGFEDLWIDYGTVDGDHWFSAKELTIQPGAKCTLKDPGSSSWLTVQGKGRMSSLNLQTPAMIRFGQNTEDEVFITYGAATAGVVIENTGSEPLVGLRYFGPDVHGSNIPKAGS